MSFFFLRSRKRTRLPTNERMNYYLTLCLLIPQSEEAELSEKSEIVCFICEKRKERKETNSPRKVRGKRPLLFFFCHIHTHFFDAFDIAQRLINFIYSVCYVRWARGCPRQHICSKYLKNRWRYYGKLNQKRKKKKKKEKIKCPE